jgi:hypothetical protein
MRKLEIKLEKIGYLVHIDIFDFQYIAFLEKEIQPLEFYKKLIKKHYDKYSPELQVIIYELYYDKSRNLSEIFGLYNLKNFLSETDIIVNNLDYKDFENIYLKEKERKVIEMDITEKNKMEYYENKFNQLSDALFDYNGAEFLCNKDVLNELIKFLNDLKIHLKN